MSNARELAELGGSYGTGGFVGMKNRIINGSFAVWQRGASFPYTAGSAGDFMPDRWWIYGSNPGSGTFERSADVPAGQGLAYSFFNNTPGVFSIGTNVELLIQGSAAPFVNGQSYTLTFWIKANSSGTSTVYSQYENVHASGTDRVAISSTSFSVTSSWQKITWTFTISVNPHANNRVLALEFGGLGAGFKIAGVQLEPGSASTLFEHRPYGMELMFCQRYLPVLQGVNYSYPCAGLAQSATVANVIYPFKVTPRVPPTGIVVIGVGGFGATTQAFGGTATSISFSNSGLDSCNLYITTNSGYTTGLPCYMTSSSNSSSIQFTGCEL